MPMRATRMWKWHDMGIHEMKALSHGHRHIILVAL